MIHNITLQEKIAVAVLMTAPVNDNEFDWAWFIADAEEDVLRDEASPQLLKDLGRSLRGNQRRLRRRVSMLYHLAMIQHFTYRPR